MQGKEYILNSVTAGFSVYGDVITSDARQTAADVLTCVTVGKEQVLVIQLIMKPFKLAVQWLEVTIYSSTVFKL